MRQDDPGFILFSGYQPNRRASGAETWAMRPDGTDLRQLAFEPDNTLSFSPGGDFIAIGTFDGGLIVSRSDGSERQPVTLPTKNGLAAWPSVSPDGRKVAFVFADNPTFTGARDLWTVSVGEDDFKQVSSTGDVYTSAWSPDGEQIAFMDGERDAICLVRADGGEPRRVAEGGEPAWSPDGKRIAYTARNGGIRILDLSNGESELVSEDGGIPAWSPDGKQLAFLEGKPCGEVNCNRIVIVDLASGKMHRVGPELAEAGFLAWTVARVPVNSDEEAPPPPGS